jgi:hypothetical protein
MQGGRYVLLAGDETVVPVRYAYPYDVAEIPDITMLQACDLYYADLTGRWDVDGDGTFGERDIDSADVEADLIVGRLPLANAVQFDAYIDKLIAYEENPGHGEFDYLTRAFFFSSDQMRDYSGGGQHGRIAQAFPPHFFVDTATGVEITRGDDPSPANLSAPELESTMAEGSGVVNVIAHGTTHRFEVRTSGYNNFPKSFFVSDSMQTTQGRLSSFNADGKTGLFYSLACNNGAFDLDVAGEAPNVAVALLAAEDAGAVVAVAYSRWGWVGSSHLLQRAFFDSLFAHPDLPAAEAFYSSKLQFEYYRDLAYGLNFLGDPTLRIYTNLPERVDLAEQVGLETIEVLASSQGEPLPQCRMVLADSLGIIGEAFTDEFGSVTFNLAFAPGEEYSIAAVTPGYCISLVEHTPSIAADVDDLPGVLPSEISLAQNYPNPFNPQTTIVFDLSRRSPVRLDILNVLGQTVATLVDEVLPTGRYQTEFLGTTDGGEPLASGIYWYRLTSPDFVQSRKMLLLR